MKVYWGILGTGSISAKVVEFALQKAGDDHEVIAVGSRSVESAKQFAEKRNIRKFYGSYSEVIEDPEVRHCISNDL
jgi:predicted dehydrogenase